MKLGRLVGSAALCAVLASLGAAPGSAFADTVTIPADCTVLADAGLGKVYSGTFTDTVRSDCLELPPLAANAPIVVLQPLSGITPVPVKRTIAAADGTVVCAENTLAIGSCVLRGTAPFRLLVAPSRTAYSTGGYQIVVQPLAGDSRCAADLPLGAIGSDTGLDVSLTADAFARCVTLPAGTAPVEFLTADRTSGVGSAQFAVYDKTGYQVCTSSIGPAAVAECGFLSRTNAYTLLVWGQARESSYRFTRRDVTKTGTTDCAPVTSTILGGPATAGSIAAASDVQCYQFTAAAGDRYLTGLRSPSPRVYMTWLADNGPSFCYETSSCVTSALSAARTYRIAVWSSAGTTVPFRLDTWALTNGGVPSPACETVPSIAYGIASIAGTMSESQTGRCLVAPVGSGERFQVVSDHAAVTAHWVDTGMPANNSSRLAGCAATTSCQLTVGWPPAGTRTSVLFLLGAGSDFGTYDYQAQLTCLTAPCGAQAYGISAVSPANLLAGDTVTLTMTGAAFDTSDAVKLAKAGSPAIMATVRGVSADRHTLTAVADLTGATAGTWTVTATSSLAGTSGSWTGLAVTLPKITARAAPAITGSVKVGSAIHATTGTWSPEATSFSYQWSSNGVAIGGATGSTYVVPAAQRGHRLTVTVTARLAGHADGRSASTAKVVATGDAPRATKAPWITGTVKTKHAVRVSVGSWTPKPDGYRYEWRLDGKLINGATKASLKITSKMAGHKLTVTVIAMKAGHNDGRRTSASIKVKR